MSAKVLRTFALGRCTPAVRPARERGLAQATGRLIVASSTPCARFVTAQMRGFAASISPVRAVWAAAGRAA